MKVNAQEAGLAMSDQYLLSKGDVIWSGNTNINKFKDFRYDFNSEDWKTIGSTIYNFNVKRIALLNEKIGLGFDLYTQFIIGNKFDGFNFSYFGTGPILRGYLLEKPKYNIYLEGSTIVGYQLALSDALGFNQSSGGRIRPGMKFGMAYIVGSKAAIFIEIGPDWEGGLQSFDIDSKSISLSIGIQFLRNK